jgi:hypothetical protein
VRNTPGWPILEWTVTPLQSVEARAEMEREFAQGRTALKPVQWPHRNGPAYLPDGRAVARSGHGRASKIILKVSVARLIFWKPPAPITSRTFANPPVLREPRRLRRRAAETA